MKDFQAEMIKAGFTFLKNKLEKYIKQEDKNWIEEDFQSIFDGKAMEHTFQKSLLDFLKQKNVSNIFADYRSQKSFLASFKGSGRRTKNFAQRVDALDGDEKYNATLIFLKDKQNHKDNGFCVFLLNEVMAFALVAKLEEKKEKEEKKSSDDNKKSLNENKENPTKNTEQNLSQSLMFWDKDKEGKNKENEKKREVSPIQQQEEVSYKRRKSV